ncbi:enoyl-CoA hydratase/isomerase family protein [Maricaulis salignorans]|uniref:enoyl-CoA hydratase/isomerase family protein n=1 Tax=Maricaulis salignorans TaxID=144026 RepID=UPI003A93C45C
MIVSAAAQSGILVSHTDGVARLTLNRPGRGNSLTPGLLDALSQALKDAAGTARAVVLSGTGSCFSSGGDVAAIREHNTSAEDLQTYSDALVGGLNRVLLQLRALPCPVIAAVNGPVTGGSLGLVLAADLSLMVRTAFIQPYYAQMGFAPDGGWTALLPDRIGRARTARWLALDQRVSADEALEMGLIDQLAEPAGFDQALTDMLARLEAHDASVIATSRQLLDAQAGPGGLAGRLDAERQAFLIQVARPQTRVRMDRFLGGSSKPAEVEAHA